MGQRKLSESDLQGEEVGGPNNKTELSTLILYPKTRARMQRAGILASKLSGVKSEDLLWEGPQCKMTGIEEATEGWGNCLPFAQSQAYPMGFQNPRKCSEEPTANHMEPRSPKSCGDRSGFSQCCPPPEYCPHRLTGKLSFQDVSVSHLHYIDGITEA